jgi:cullin 4
LSRYFDRFYYSQQQQQQQKQIETPKALEDLFNKHWPYIEEAVKAIHNSRPVSMSLEILYQFVENLCAEKKSNLLYTSLKQLCEEHIKSELPKLTIYPFLFLNFNICCFCCYCCLIRYLNSLFDSSSFSFSFGVCTPIDDQCEYLKLLNRHWEDHCSQMMMICQIFLPLDRGYVLNNPLILSIWDLSLELFKTHIISNRLVQTRCVNGLLFLIDHERNGELIDRSLVKSLLNMLYKLQVNFY